MAIYTIYYQRHSGTFTRWFRDGKVERPRPSTGVYTRNNPYRDSRFQTHGIAKWTNGTPLVQVWDASVQGKIDREIDLLLERAKSKFRNKVTGDTASLGITIAQYDQALSMIGNRSGTLARFAVKLPYAALVLKTGLYFQRRAALRDLAKTLRAPVNSPELRRLQRRSARDWRKRIKTPGDLFLEFWFGWAPLVGDMSAAANVLSSPTPQRRTVRANVKSHVEWTDGSRLPYPYGYRFTKVAADISVGLYSTFNVENPNVHLANRLGLVNLGSIVWDAIPFSWLVNWFTNMNQFLNALTWDAGISLQTGTIGYGSKVANFKQEVDQRYLGEISEGFCSGYRKERKQLSQSALTSLPPLRLNPPTGSLTRALTMTALLLQRVSKL